MTCAALALAACRDDGGGAEPPADAQVPVVAPAPPPTVAITPPREVAWNAEDTLVITVTNRTAAAMDGAILDIFVQAPVEVPGLPKPSGEGTTLVLPVGLLPPGVAREFRQPVRTPPAPAPGTSVPTRFVVRASLAERQGAPRTTVTDTLRIRSGSEVAAGGCASAKGAAALRYGIGPVRMGMTGAALRAACPEARDTTWRGAEGMEEKGMAVTIGGEPVVAVTAGDSVRRIVVERAGIRTAGGLGIGSTIGELRARMGRICADEAEGAVAVWSPSAPGVSFGLDAKDTGDWATAGKDPDVLKDEFRVTRMWVHGQDFPCPARPATGAP
ncbi:MAG TPA: hypothetical protein VE913_15415 [Longimicrobium sp.]|nr:hypothetical protein [Longimicrobium sp.]